jgi:hypothetical protein
MSAPPRRLPAQQMTANWGRWSGAVPSTCNIEGKRDGYIDYCTQSRVEGWASWIAGPAVTVRISVNGDDPVEVHPTIKRPDAEAAGYCLRSGFDYAFPRWLAAGDIITVSFPDGSPLSGSPTTPDRPRLQRLLDGIDITLPGIEIGPAYQPILSKTSSGVLYADRLSRAELIAKYQRDIDAGVFNAEQLCDIDIIWSSSSLKASLPPGFEPQWLHRLARHPTRAGHDRLADRHRRCVTGGWVPEPCHPRSSAYSGSAARAYQIGNSDRRIPRKAAATDRGAGVRACCTDGAIANACVGTAFCQAHGAKRRISRRALPGLRAGRIRYGDGTIGVARPDRVRPTPLPRDAGWRDRVLHNAR